MNKLNKIEYKVNGKVYKNIQDIPKEHRKFFEDKNKNRIVDVFENSKSNKYQ